MVAAICSLILLGCGQGVKSAKKKKRRVGAGGRHSHLLALISSLQYQCGPCAFIEGKKKESEKRESMTEVRSRVKGGGGGGGGGLPGSLWAARFSTYPPFSQAS